MQRCFLLLPPLLALTGSQPVAIDPSGAVFIPQFDQEARFHEEVARSRWSSNPMEFLDGASSAVLQHPYTILHAPSGDLYVASFTLNHVVRLRWTEGEKQRARYNIFISGRELDGPVGMALSDDGDSLYVASFTNDVVLRVNTSSGNLLGYIGSDETLDCPEGIAIGPDGLLYVTSFLLPHLSVFDPSSGDYRGRFGTLPTARNAGMPPSRIPSLAGAEDLTFDLNGDLHVTAYYSSAVFKFNGTSGELVYSYAKGIVHGPVGIACDPGSGDIFVSSYKDSRVLRFSSGGQFVGVAAGTGVLDGAGPTTARRRRKRGNTISSPSGLTFADDGTLWVASYTTGAVTRFNSSYGGGGRTWRVTD
jgi:streptogramin lyase